MVLPGHYANNDPMLYTERATNVAAATRVKVLHAASFMQDDISGVPSSTQVYSCLFRTGATTRTVRCSMILQPLQTHDVANDSYLQWQLTPTGGSYVYQDEIRTEKVDSSIQPGDYIRVDQDWTDLEPDTEYLAILERHRYQRWVSFTIFETQLSQIPYLATPLAGVDPQRSAVGSEIRQQEFEDIWTSQKNLWRLNGATISQSKLEATTWSTASATIVGVYDAALTAWATANPGHYFYGEYKNPQGGSSTTEVPVRLWAYGYCTASGTGTLELHGTGGSEVSVAITSGTPVLVTADGTIPATNAKYEPFFKTTAGTFYIFGWGFYEYEA
jgi:hypothetical protein